VGFYADRLIDKLRRPGPWPPPWVDRPWKDTARWIAHREGDREVLRMLAGWTDRQRRYRIDPLAEKISEAYADLLYSRPPIITAANESDQDVLDDLVRENRLVSELPRSWVTASSEGEVFWRLLVDKNAADHPLIEWHSRVGVIPYFIGKKLVAAAFVSRLEEWGSDQYAWRHFEVHDGTDVYNLLFRGHDRVLGEIVDVDQHPDTAGLIDARAHGLPSMPCGWIPNKLGTDPTRGISDYASIEDFLLDLNESVSVAAENMRLTAKKRVAGPASMLDSAGNFNASTEFLVVDSDDDIDGDRVVPKVIEYSFDAAAMIAYQDQVARQAITRAGLNGQFAGVPVDAEGAALSGVAYRIRLIPSVNAGDKRGSLADPELQRMIYLAALVDAQPEDDGGFGRAWVQPEEPPSVERQTALPEDLQEMASRHSTLKAQGLISLRTSLEERYPNRSPDWIDDEIERIQGEEPPAPEGGVFGSF
jgi:hypothetical protein